MRWIEGLVATVLASMLGGCPATVEDVSWRLHDEIESLVIVSWSQIEPANTFVEYRFDDEVWLQTPEIEAASGSREQLLLGIPYDTSLEFRVVSDPGDGPLAGEVFEATTGPLPEGLPLPTVLESDPSGWEPTGSFLLGSINEVSGYWTEGHYWKFIVDRAGRVVWALLTPDAHWSIHLLPSRDGGDLLWDDATWWEGFDWGAGSRVHRMKIDGSIVHSHDTPGLHHAYTELPDGTIVWGATHEAETVHSAFETLEASPPQGDPYTIWDCAQFDEEYEVGLVGVEAWPACQSNAVHWREPADTFVVSFYTHSFVLEIDHTTGDPVRIWAYLGPDDHWTFDPVQSTFRFPHDANYTDQGTLLLSSWRAPNFDEAVVREYVVHDDTRTLEDVWSVGQDTGVAVPNAGMAQRLPGGNTLQNTGTTAHVREWTPDKALVWELAWESPRLLGRTVFLDDLYDFAP